MKPSVQQPPVSAAPARQVPESIKPASGASRVDRVSTLMLLIALSLAQSTLAAPAPSVRESVQSTPTASDGSLPRFRVEKTEENWWFVPPDGRRFFSVGVCVLHPGPGREGYDPENPAYAFWKNHPTQEAWADTSLKRLKSWGFTTAAGWSDPDSLKKSPEQTLWLTPVLHIGSAAGAPWWDMWDEANVRRMESAARQQIAASKGDDRVIGYYSDNELGWWNATLWKMTLEQPPSSGQRRRLIQFLRTTYQEDWSLLTREFTAEGAADWETLGGGGALFMKPGGNGIRVMRQFLGMLADRYYELMRAIILGLDPRALYLGDRYQSFYYPEVAEACGRHADVVSSNLNAAWTDGTFPRFQLDTLHRITGKPVLVSEIYLAARDNRSGNRNDHGIYPVAGNQRRRAEATERTLESLARLPYVVGVDWFQYSDEPTHGRDDGENFNFGLVDIQDQPYEEVTSVFSRFSPQRHRNDVPRKRMDASSGVPRAREDPFSTFVPTRALLNWDRERGFIKPSSDRPLADLYICWTPRAVFLGLYALDIVEEAYYQGPSIPKADRALWTVAANGFSVRARLGSGREALVSDPRVRMESLSGLNLNVRNVAVMEIPAALLGRRSLKAGDHIELNVELLTHGRAYSVAWRSALELAR